MGGAGSQRVPSWRAEHIDADSKSQNGRAKCRKAKQRLCTLGPGVSDTSTTPRGARSHSEERAGRVRMASL